MGAKMNEHELEQFEDGIVLDLKNIMMDVWRCVRKFWALMVVCVVIAATVGAFWAKSNYQPEYSAEMTFIVYLRHDYIETEFKEYTYNISEENKLKNVLIGVTKLDLYDELIREGLDVSRVDGKIGLSAVSESNRFKLTVSGSSSPEEALRVLEEAYKHLPTAASYAIGEMKVETVSAPYTKGAPDNSPETKQGMLYGIVVAVAACAVLIGGYVLRRLLCIHKEADLQDLLGIHSYGKIRKCAEDDVRSVALRLEKNLRGQQKQVVLVAGSVAEEENAAVSAILAKMFVKNGSRVLLADCDLVSPRQGELLGVSGKENLFSALLSGEKDWKECVKGTGESGIDFVGNMSPEADASRLISSDNFRLFLKEAREAYDYLVFNAPGRQNTAGIAVAAGASDGILYLVDDSIISTKKIRADLDELTDCGAQLMGGVFCSK